MCTYVEHIQTYRACTKADKHTKKRTLWNYCERSNNIDPCNDTSPDPDMVLGSSTIPGGCPVCANPLS
ncbi:hypothetical protein DL98DRAFT_522211 [Cadophora sp. DSE1049]|nr:hypothetical protein DL98DRAFT_522211 [Cadophora sp. DSE1049]